MTISFDAIPVAIRTPGQFIEIDSTAALQGLVGIPVKILVLGQRLAAGGAAALTPVQVLDEDQAEAFFGRGSMLHLMFRALKRVNHGQETWAIAMDDAGAAAAAAGDILFAGTATAAGTVNLYVGGQRVRTKVASGDTAAAVATAVVADIAAATDLPVTAVVNGVTAEQVDLTARNKGEAGNAIDLRFNYFAGEALPAGITATITALSGGTANPDVQSAIDVFGQEWWTDIVLPYTDPANFTALETELDVRFGPLAQQDAHAYVGANASHATLTTLGNARNSPHLSIMGMFKSPSPSWTVAAALCGVCAFHAKQDPARPFQTLALTGILAPNEQDRFTREERDLLLNDGIATSYIDNGGVVRIERVITTYQTNPQSVPDASFLDLNTMKTLAFLRWTTRARIALKYPRHKLADDGTRFGPGQAIVTPSVIRAEMVALFREWEDLGLAEDIEQFKTDLIVERDSGDPTRVNALIPPDVVNQFRVFAGKVQFRL